MEQTGIRIGIAGQSAKSTTNHLLADEAETKGPERRKRLLQSAKMDGGRSPANVAPPAWAGRCRARGVVTPTETPSGSAGVGPRLRAGFRPGRRRQRLAEHIPGFPNARHAAGTVVQGVPHPPDPGRVHLPEPIPHQSVRVPVQPPLPRVVRAGEAKSAPSVPGTSACLANSLPLSSVIDGTRPDTGPRQSMIAATASAAVLLSTG